MAAIPPPVERGFEKRCRREGSSAPRQSGASRARRAAASAAGSRREYRVPPCGRPNRVRHGPRRRPLVRRAATVPEESHPYRNKPKVITRRETRLNLNIPCYRPPSSVNLRIRVSQLTFHRL